MISAGTDTPNLPFARTPVRIFSRHCDIIAATDGAKRARTEGGLPVKKMKKNVAPGGRAALTGESGCGPER